MRMQQLKLSLAGMVLLATSVPVFAQPGPGGRGGFGPPGGDFGLGLGMLEDALDLTEAQKTAIKAITDQARTQSQTLMTQLQTSREQLRTAAKANASDVELDRLAQQQSAATTQLTALQAKTFRQVWQQLTPEQKAILEKRDARMQNRTQRRGPVDR